MGIARKIVARALSQRVLTGRSKRIVFLYHDISDPGSPQYSPGYSTQVKIFRSQVDLIAKYFKLVSLEEVVARDSNHQQRLATITFDDGFLSVKDEALPYLQAKGIPFSIFVSSMAIKQNRLFYGPEDPSINRSYERKVFLDEGDVAQFASQGIPVGSHSSTHRNLSECDEATLKEEVLENKLYLESLTGTKVRHIALPFGKREHYNQHVLNFCHSVGHDYVYTTNPSYFELAPGQRLIPRLPIINHSPEELFFIINRPLVRKVDI